MELQDTYIKFDHNKHNIDEAMGYPTGHTFKLAKHHNRMVEEAVENGALDSSSKYVELLVKNYSKDDLAVLLLAAREESKEIKMLVKLLGKMAGLGPDILSKIAEH